MTHIMSRTFVCHRDIKGSCSVGLASWEERELSSCEESKIKLICFLSVNSPYICGLPVRENIFILTIFT